MGSLSVSNALKASFLRVFLSSERKRTKRNEAERKRTKLIWTPNELCDTMYMCQRGQEAAPQNAEQLLFCERHVHRAAFLYTPKHKPAKKENITSEASRSFFAIDYCKKLNYRMTVFRILRMVAVQTPVFLKKPPQL